MHKRKRQPHWASRRGNEGKEQHQNEPRVEQMTGPGTEDGTSKRRKGGENERGMVIK